MPGFPIIFASLTAGPGTSRWNRCGRSCAAYGTGAVQKGGKWACVKWWSIDQTTLIYYFIKPRMHPGGRLPSRPRVQAHTSGPCQ